MRRQIRRKDTGGPCRKGRHTGISAVEVTRLGDIILRRLRHLLPLESLKVELVDIRHHFALGDQTSTLHVRGQSKSQSAGMFSRVNRTETHIEVHLRPYDRSGRALRVCTRHAWKLGLQEAPSTHHKLGGDISSSLAAEGREIGDGIHGCWSLAVGGQTPARGP